MRHSKGMIIMNLPRRLLSELIKRSNSDLKSVSEKIGKNHAYLQQYLTRGTPRILSEEVRHALGDVLGVDPDVFREETDPSRVELKSPLLSQTMENYASMSRVERTMAQRAEYRIPEYTSLPFIEEEGTARPVHFWSFPREWIDSFVVDARHLAILRVTGDGMATEYNVGDRVLVDLTCTIPSLPAVYVLSDGANLVMKRIEIIFGSDPVRVRIMSYNPIYATYECPLSEVKICGRIVGQWSWK